jgi:hypothetical protein
MNSASDLSFAAIAAGNPWPDTSATKRYMKSSTVK